MPIYMGFFTKANVLDKKFMGDVTARGYEGWIELQSAQLGQMRRVGAVGASNQPAQPVQEIVITKSQDDASTALFRESLHGKGRLIVIVFAKEDGTTYMKLVLQNTLISSYSVSGHGGDTSSGPMESFSLNFSNITYEASPKSPDTTHRQMYDLSQYDLSEQKGA